MKRFFIHSLGVAIIAVLASCGDDPLPEPLPAFDASTELEIFEIAQPIQFINSSTNAASYLWDFGDGNTSEEINPIHAYETPGNYTVVLTATTDDDQMATADLLLQVGQRELVAIGVLGIDFNNRDSQGQVEGPWDEGSGPDILLLFGPADDDDLSESLITPVVTDVTEPFEPFGFELNEPLPLTNEIWTLAMLDDDSDEDLAPQLMIQTTDNFNPILNSNSIVNPETGEGRISISGGGFELFLDFEIN